jgi:hypothetical protein
MELSTSGGAANSAATQEFSSILWNPKVDHSNYAWRRVQVMKLLIMQFSPTSYHFIPLWSKYSPQHPVLKHPESIFLP